MNKETDENWTNRFDESDAHAAEAQNAESGAAMNDAQASDTNSEEKCGDTPCMPKPTFSTFVLSLASSALVQLGEVPDPATGEHMEDLAIAKHTIDILSMLQEKITSGLDAEEARLLEGLLYELRMKFVMKK